MKTLIATAGKSFKAPSKRVLVLTMTTLIIFIAGCSKKSESSNITIALPDFSALDKKQNGANESPTAQSVVTVTSRIMINVTGPDISTPLVYIWDLNSQPRDASGNLAKAPESVSLDVTRGPNRIFQVLAIRGTIDTDNDDHEGAMTFYYGDETRSISDANTSLVLTLAARGTSSGPEGNISGRYFNADGSTPTGKINMYYAPPGKPEMIVDQSQTMFSGFFQIFLPADLDFSYRIAGSGLTLFEKVNVSTVHPNSNAIVKIQVPAGYRNRGNGTARVATSARTKVAGFFGYGNLGRATCYSTTAATLPGLYMYPAVGSTLEVPWLPASVSSAEARVESGGLGNATGTCPSAVEFGSDHFTINTRNISFGDSPMGFHGPFRELSDGSSQYLTAAHTGAAIRLNWKYLKPTLGNSVAGLGVFRRTYATVAEANTKRWNDNVPCGTLATGFGFTEITRVPFGTTSSPVETYDIADTTPAVFSSGLQTVVVCPYTTAGAYHEFGLVARGPTGNYSSPATKIMTSIKATNHTGVLGDETKIGQTVCVPIDVRTVDTAGAPAYRQSGNGITPQVTLLLAGGAPADLYDNNVCSGVGSKSLNVSMYNTIRTAYIKSDDSNSMFQLAASDTTSGGSPITSTLSHLAAIPKATPTNLRSVVSSTSIVAHQCYPIDFVRGTMSGVQFVPNGGGYANPTFASNISSYPGLGFFSNSSCDGTQPSGAYFSGDNVSTVPMYFKYTGAANSISILPAGGVYATDPLALTVAQPGPVSQAVIVGSNSIPAEQCVPIRVQLRDSQGRLSVSGNAYSGQLGTVPSQAGVFYSESTCMTQTSGAVAIPSGQTQSDAIYARWLAAGTVNFTLVSATPNGLPDNSFAVTVGPPQAAYIGVYTNGVTFNPVSATYVGSGPQVIFGLNMVQLHFTAVTPLGNIATTFNDTDVSVSGINLVGAGGSIACNPLTWTNGQATSFCTLPDLYTYTVVNLATGGNAKYQYHPTAPMMFGTRAADQFQTAIYGRSGSVADNNCVPLLVSRRAGNMYPTLAPTNFNVNLSFAGGISNFYLDAGCSSATMTATIPALSSATVVYMKTTAAGNPIPTADGMAPVDPVNGGAPAWPINTIGSPAKYLIVMETQSKLMACEPMLITRTDANGGSVFGAPTAVILTSSGVAAKFYPNGDCSGTEITSTAFTATDRAKLVFIKSNLTGTGSVSVSDGNGLSGTIPMMTVGY